MTPEQEQKLIEQVGQIHSTLFGVEGQGGLHRRVEALEKHKESVSVLIAKISGAVVVLGGLASFLGAKLAHWLGFTNNITK